VFHKYYDYRSRAEPQALACAEHRAGFKPADQVVTELMKHGTSSRAIAVSLSGLMQLFYKT